MIRLPRRVSPLGPRASSPPRPHVLAALLAVVALTVATAVLPVGSVAPAFASGLAAEQEVAGLATTRVLMTDFGMVPPQAGPALAIEDELALEVDFLAARSIVAGLGPR